MKNFRLKWVKAGKPHISVVAYDMPSAERRKQKLEEPDQGVTDVEIVSVKLGEDL
ncbi:hypothetical protein OHB13_11920 [Streptomyces sp. NBC_00440]|uniref:hypothetical protein n=1 Tax=Streptomyces sp. NBC_00440 TaxID=2975741 RepID=UPI002E250D75